MPYKQANSKYYWITYYSGGRQLRESSGTSSFREAKTIEQAKRAAAAKQKQSQSKHSFDRMMLLYLEDIKDLPKYPRAVYAFQQLLPHFTGMDVDDVTSEDISAYIDDRGVAHGTLIKELHTFSAAVRHVNKKYRWDIRNPTLGEVPKQPQGRMRWLTQAQATKLLKHASKSKQAPYLADLITLVLNTGLRRQEALGLEWDRVDLRRGLVYLGPKDQKSARHSSVPLNKAAKDAIKRQKGIHDRFVFTFRGQPIHDAKKSFQKACNDSGIEDFTFHDLRHTACAWLVQKGNDMRTVAEVMRHKSIQTTMRYAHLSPKAAKRAVDGVNFG